MKRLWKTVPPCMADVLGFEAVLNGTEGLGIIDDCGRYKPIGAGKSGGPGGRGERGGRGSGESGGWPGRGRGHGEGGWERGGRPGYGFARERGGSGGRGGRDGDLRVVNSEIRNPDVITGTEKKVLAAFEEGAARFQPNFVLLCHAPSSSMIGSDLEGNALRIAEESGLPAAYVNADGGKDWLYGEAVTLEAMGKLLLAKPEQTRIPGTVNLLGCDPIGWTAETLASVEAWLTEGGFRVLSRWGMRETTENLRLAAGAETNLVVSEAGLRLARYMKTEFEIPYIVGAPFGRARCDSLLRALRVGETAFHTAAAPEGGPAVLVVGEQLTADAIRAALRDRGYRSVRVLSFCDMDKAVMEPGDAKLNSEDELAAELARENVELVLCDPDCRPLLGERAVRWIGLPNPGSHSVFEHIAPFNMAGGALDAWLTSALNQGGIEV